MTVNPWGVHLKGMSIIEGYIIEVGVYYRGCHSLVPGIEDVCYRGFLYKAMSIKRSDYFHVAEGSFILGYNQSLAKYLNFTTQVE